MADTIGTIQGEEVSEVGGQIMEARRRCVVHVPQPIGGGATQALSTGAAIVAALGFAIIPADGESYEDSQPEVRVYKRTGQVLGIDPTGMSIVQVDVFYKWMPIGGFIRQGGSGVEVVRTPKDNTDTVMTDTNDGETTYLEAPALRPTVNATVEIYNASTPVAFYDNYVGRINSSVWNGGGVGTWFCIGAEHEKQTVMNNVGGGLRKYTVNFSYRKEGWKYEGLFYDVATGRTVNQIYEYEIYKTANFNALIDLSNIAAN